MEERRRFNDTRCEIVWLATEALDPGEQYVILREIATLFAQLAADPRTLPDKVRAAVVALRQAADILDRSPSINDYRDLRQRLPELSLPAESNIRRWLGGGWNDCLARALLDAVADGDSPSRPIGVNDFYEDDEVLAALRECSDDLNHAPTLTEYLAWARRPDVRERPGRRPRSYKPVERCFGGMRAALAAAGVIGKTDARYAANGRVLALRFAYNETDIADALRTATGELGHSPRTVEYERVRRRLNEAHHATGQMTAMPTVDTIRRRHGSWNAALRQAGLDPITDPRQPHVGEVCPAYSDDDKLAWIREAWTALGEPFTAASYKRWRAERLRNGERNIPCLATLDRTFGGWRRARALAVPRQQATESAEPADE